MDCKQLSKYIIEYLLRVFCFILVIKYCFFYLMGICGLVVTPIIIAEIIFIRCITKGTGQLDIEINNDLPIADFSTFDICLMSFVTLYLLAKIFGIFKKLDKINIIISIEIIVIISYLLILIGKIKYLTNDITYELFGIEYSYTMYLLIPAFFLYKFFGFLTKKCPFPFERIGYYTSIEFIKDTLFKIKKKLKF